MSTLSIVDLKLLVNDYITIFNSKEGEEIFEDVTHISSFPSSEMRDIFDWRYGFLKKRLLKVEEANGFSCEEFFYEGIYIDDFHKTIAYAPITCEEKIIKNGYIFNIFELMNFIYQDIFSPFPHFNQFHMPMDDCRHYVYIPVIRSENIKDNLLQKFTFYSTILSMLKTVKIGHDLMMDTKDEEYIPHILSLVITCAYFKEYDMDHILEIANMSKTLKKYIKFFKDSDFFVRYAQDPIVNTSFFNPYADNEMYDQLQDQFSEIIAEAITIAVEYPFSHQAELFGEVIGNLFLSE